VDRSDEDKPSIDRRGRFDGELAGADFVTSDHGGFDIS
jgi:hypothetical protein